MALSWSACPPSSGGHELKARYQVAITDPHYASEHSARSPLTLCRTPAPAHRSWSGPTFRRRPAFPRRRDRTHQSDGTAEGREVGVRRAARSKTKTISRSQLRCAGTCVCTLAKTLRLQVPQQWHLCSDSIKAQSCSSRGVSCPGADIARLIFSDCASGAAPLSARAGSADCSRAEAYTGATKTRPTCSLGAAGAEPLRPSGE